LKDATIKNHKININKKTKKQTNSGGDVKEPCNTNNRSTALETTKKRETPGA
jgi:hypothetical protein